MDADEILKDEDLVMREHLIELGLTRRYGDLELN